MKECYVIILRQILTSWWRIIFLSFFLSEVVTLIAKVDWDLGDGYAVGIFVSAGVVFTLPENLGDCKKREKQGEPESSLRHG